MKKNILLIVIAACICFSLMLIYDSIENNTITSHNTEHSYSTSHNTSASSNSDSENLSDNNTNDPKNTSGNIDIIIKDETFVSQLDNIITSIDQYVGKRIQVDGIISTIKDNNFLVIRLYDMEHDGHSHEITVGINASYDGTLPKENTWVTVTGIIEKDTIDSRTLPRIKVEHIKEHDTYGQEKVYN